MLAAGRSTRMGRAKGLLDAGGVSFLRRCVESLRGGGCDPVVVVVNADSPWQDMNAFVEILDPVGVSAKLVLHLQARHPQIAVEVEDAEAAGRIPAPATMRWAEPTGIKSPASRIHSSRV